MPLVPVGAGLHLLDGDRVRMLGIPFATRSFVVRLAVGDVVVISPVAPSEERFGAVGGLGPVRHLVAPNAFHNLFLAPWAERFPGVRVWGDERTRRRKPERPWTDVLVDAPPEEWAEELDQVVFRGSSVLEEVVFLHRPSRTLLVTDIVQSHEPAEESAFFRVLKRWNAILAPDAGAPRDWRLTVRDRAAARACRDRILGWDFDRIALAHGRCVEADGKRRFAQAFAWLG